ncbi:hypothetical protein [Antarcticimicrobium sediminis]|uniref:Uncharacterized protein n=1 Tax=Antarcticimicrobium sediminis TaxID=2546227 RepID=A0A4R5F0R0_9RHOB|nr:hypothetical protein [Antarcticimicrobium sediminis]TDE40852.1 hypothetical protein E1B25_01140 [Antarcticimicrobium sediminis]
MNFGFDIEESASVSSQARSDMIGVSVIVVLVAILGFFGRLIFVVYRGRLAGLNPLRGVSGWGMIGVAAALFAGVLVMTGKQRSVIIGFKARLVDPFVVSVLKRDSCDVAGKKYCVVVFEEDREIFVNWYDRRVSMFQIVNKLDFNPVRVSPHPMARVR